VTSAVFDRETREHSKAAHRSAHTAENSGASEAARGSGAEGAGGPDKPDSRAGRGANCPDAPDGSAPSPAADGMETDGMEPDGTETDGMEPGGMEPGGMEADGIKSLAGLDGLHFHTMCEQGAGTLARTLTAVERRFGQYLRRMKWVNFGGGHHITRPGYDAGALVGSISRFQEKHGVAVYLEPGEAVALNTGFLISTVLDTVNNGMDIAILDTSAACHMPDVLEMPYRPHVIGGAEPGKLRRTYRLGGPTCLAGDVIGDYSFDKPLSRGDRLVFTDMAHYTMVKNNTFNGVNLPSIAILSADGQLSVVRRFDYGDFKGRLS
jgi:carboxynorspermidine decarboxylase